MIAAAMCVERMTMLPEEPEFQGWTIGQRIAWVPEDVQAAIRADERAETLTQAIEYLAANGFQGAAAELKCFADSLAADPPGSKDTSTQGVK
jgi:hypothetical protein